MHLNFEQGARFEDLVQALRQVGCVILDDETGQPDNPTLDGYFPKTGTGVYYPTAYGCEQPKFPGRYFPDDQQLAAAWRVGSMMVSPHPASCRRSMPSWRHSGS